MKFCIVSCLCCIVKTKDTFSSVLIYFYKIVWMSPPQAQKGKHSQRPTLPLFFAIRGGGLHQAGLSPCLPWSRKPLGRPLPGGRLRGERRLWHEGGWPRLTGEMLGVPCYQGCPKPTAFCQHRVSYLAETPGVGASMLHIWQKKSFLFWNAKVFNNLKHAQRHTA